MLIIERLEEVAVAHGARLGVTDLSPFPAVAASIADRNRAGLSADLGFTYRAATDPSTPAETFPWARSIVVLAVPYLTSYDSQRGEGPIARFADGDRYVPVRNVLAEIARVLVDQGARVEEVLDDDRLVDRAVAVRAGIAWWGKSTMALTPGLGPWFLIGSVVTDMELPVTPPMTRTCGTCTACIPACPTGAIVQPGILDARRCLAAIFQSRGSIPREFRREAGPRVYGCDACLVACPPGDQALRIEPIGSTKGRAAVSAAGILAMTDREIDREFAHWFIPGRKARFVRRNALVALGNTAPECAEAILGGYLGHPDPLLREHAAWALGRLGTELAHAMIDVAMTTEVHPDVRAELVQSGTGHP